VYLGIGDGQGRISVVITQAILPYQALKSTILELGGVRPIQSTLNQNT